MKDGEILIGIMASLGRAEYPVRSLLALTRPFGVSPSSLRTALSRLAKKGVVEARRRDGEAAYAFAAKGRLITGNIAAGFAAPDWSAWDGSFWGILWSLPAADTRGRYRTAKKLALFRFASWLPGCWIRPWREAEMLGQKLETLFSNPRCRAIRFTPLKPFTEADAAALWDIAGAAAAMRAALERADAAERRLDDADAETVFIEKLLTGEALVSALFRDPLLPPEFLPADWPAPALRRRFADFDAASAERARPFWENVLNSANLGA